MRQMLRNGSLVDEVTTHSQHTRDLPERCSSAGGTSTYVVAGAEVDDEVEAPIVERKIAHVALEHRRRQPHGAQAQLCNRNEGGIDVHTHEISRPQPLSEHWKRDPAPASHLEDASTAGWAQRAQEQRNLEPFLKPIPRFDVVEGLVRIGLARPRW
jgi:hypothetical protein